jgi:single-strand DNA-binding protein
MGMAMIVQQTASDEQVLIEADRAMYAARYLSKGRPVAIDGRLEWRAWEAQDGTKCQAVDIIADSVQFLSSREQAAPENGDMPADAGFQPAPVPAGAGDEDIPF